MKPVTLILAVAVTVMSFTVLYQNKVLTQQSVAVENLHQLPNGRGQNGATRKENHSDSSKVIVLVSNSAHWHNVYGHVLTNKAVSSGRNWGIVGNGQADFVKMAMPASKRLEKKP